MMKGFYTMLAEAEKLEAEGRAYLKSAIKLLEEADTKIDELSKKLKEIVTLSES